MNVSPQRLRVNHGYQLQCSPPPEDLQAARLLAACGVAWFMSDDGRPVCSVPARSSENHLLGSRILTGIRRSLR